MIDEGIKHTGIFHVWDNPLSPEETRAVWEAHGLDGLFNRLTGYQRRHNILMAAQKLIMANAVYPRIDKLVITSQTASPNDAETSYTGTIYQTTAADEVLRSGNSNPYQVGWNITASGANGTWGSFVLVDGTGTMINRALAGVTKAANSAKLVIFTGSVT